MSEEEVVFSAEENEGESKRKRIIVAITVGAVVLLFSLVAFMSYQLICINKKRSEIAQLQMDIAALEQTIEKGEQTLETRRQRWYIERRARELGYAYADDIVLD